MTLSEFIKQMISTQNIRYEKGYFEILGTRLVVLPAYTWTNFMERVYERNGDEMFDMLFETGRFHAKQSVEKRGRQLGMSVNEFVEKMVGSANVLGLGVFEADVDVENEVLKCKLSDPAFSNEFKDSEVFSEVDRPPEELIRGMIHGFAEEFFDTSDITSEFTDDEHLGEGKMKIAAYSAKDTSHEHSSEDS